jgi:hypothetical protein
MRISVCLALVLLLAAGNGEGRQVPVEAPEPAIACTVTIPNGVAAVDEPASRGSHGTRQVSVALWADGSVVFRPGGPGFTTRSGALGMKFGWQRGVSGQLEIEGRRLDAVAPPLRSEVPRGYGDRGFQASYVIFPTPGCWQVTGRVEDATVTFVTRVVKVGAGPAWRRDVP